LDYAPLDLYFASHARRVWTATKDEPLHTTADVLARRWFGESAHARVADYLARWITEGPKFGRETGDSFIDWPLTGIAAVVEGCEARRAHLLAIDQTPLAAEQRVALTQPSPVHVSLTPRRGEASICGAVVTPLD
jgi:hypothetical protein